MHRIGAGITTREAGYCWVVLIPKPLLWCEEFAYGMRGSRNRYILSLKVTSAWARLMSESILAWTSGPGQQMFFYRVVGPRSLNAKASMMSILI